jgi:hypothetical protein
LLRDRRQQLLRKSFPLPREALQSIAAVVEKASTRMDNRLSLRRNGAGDREGVRDDIVEGRPS